jgi:dTDP-4-amino-4,6-dideoxygalactose transaminase
MQVPFFDIKKTAQRLRPQMRDGLAELLRSERLVSGRFTQRFEASLADYMGGGNPVAVGSATDALILSLRAAGIGEGDEVIVPCYSFFATVSCVLHVGATPVFVDIEPVSYAIDATKIEAAVTERTKAVMPVHLFSQMADVRAISALCEARGIMMIEDSAEGLGIFFEDRHSGLWGEMGVISFFPTKTLGALGDAGAILCRDEEQARLCRMLRDQGREGGEVSRIPGFNSRVDDIQSLFLDVRLRSIEDEIAARARLAAHYSERLVPWGSNLVTPSILPRGAQRSVFYVYLIECERRDELVRHLTASGITTETYYPLPLHLQPCCAYLGYGLGSMPVAEAAAPRALALPLYPDMSESEADYVCDRIVQFYER